MMKRLLLLCVLMGNALAIEQNAGELAPFEEQNRQYEELYKDIRPAHVKSRKAYDATQRWTRVVPYGLAALGVADFLAKVQAGGGTLEGPQELIRPGALIGSGFATAIIRSILLRHWKSSDAKKYSKRLKQVLNQWPEKRGKVPEALRGLLDQLHADMNRKKTRPVQPFHARALGRAIQPALSVVDGINEMTATEVAMPDDEHTDIIDTPKQRVRRYKKLYKQSSPQSKVSQKTYNVVSGLSALVPLGLGAASVAAGLHAHKNEKSLVPAIGLALGTGGAVWLSTFLLRRWLHGGAQKYHTALDNFLQSWPEKREAAPRALRATIDAIHEQITTHTNGMQSLSAEQAQALHSSVKTLALVDSAAHMPLSREYEKWQFVLESVGLMKGPHGFWRKLFGRTPQLLGQQIASIPLSFITMLYLSMRVPALRAYMRGYTGSPMIEPDDFNPTPAQREAARNGSVAKIFGWPNYDSQDERFSRLGPALWFTGMTLPIFYSLIKSGFAAYAAKQEHKRKLDQFISVWPAVQHAVPHALKDRFEQLYNHSFDQKKNELKISGSERANFMHRLETDALPWRALIKARGKKSTKAEKYLKRKRQGSWWARLFGRKKKPVRTKKSKTKKGLHAW